MRVPPPVRSLVTAAALQLLLPLLLPAAGTAGDRGGAGDGRPARPGPLVTRSAPERVPPSSAARSHAAPPPARVGTPAAATPAQRARAVLAHLTLDQQVGQLIMAGVPATDPAAAAALVTRYHVGEVFLGGRSAVGVAVTAARVAALRRVATRSAAPTGRVGLWVATDQEGGAVQVLGGPGFSTIPSAVTQSTRSTAALRADSALWARQLARAGLDVDLAPVTDVVPGDPALNPPIGVFRREYGRTAAAVERAVPAVVAGYADAGVTATLKHFPGLGQVTANTDTTPDVVDTRTTRSAATEATWRAGIAAGAGLVMVSSARYARIDPAHLAPFSTTVVTGMLRGDLHWRGVVISDDLGAARAVASVAPGGRALAFVQAGGDVVLTVDPTVVPAMVAALLAHARAVPGFRTRIGASALRVLTLKAEMGLLPS